MKHTLSIARHLSRQKRLRAQLPRGSLPLPFFCKIVYNDPYRKVIE